MDTGDFLLLFGKCVTTQTKHNKNLINLYKQLLMQKKENVMVGASPWFINYYDFHFEIDT